MSYFWKFASQITFLTACIKKKKKKLPANLEHLNQLSSNYGNYIFFFHYRRLIYKAEILVQQNVALKNKIASINLKEGNIIPHQAEDM